MNDKEAHHYRSTFCGVSNATITVLRGVGSICEVFGIISYVKSASGYLLVAFCFDRNTNLLTIDRLNRSKIR